MLDLLSRSSRFAPSAGVFLCNNLDGADTNSCRNARQTALRMNDRQTRFLEILKENNGRWCSIARSYAGNEADDLLQEIQLQIWKSLENFRGEASVSTWTWYSWFCLLLRRCITFDHEARRQSFIGCHFAWSYSKPSRDYRENKSQFDRHS